MASGPDITSLRAIVRVGDMMINVNLTEVLESPEQALKISDAEFERNVSVAAAKLN